jgi:hypothetical protein
MQPQQSSLLRFNTVGVVALRLMLIFTCGGRAKSTGVPSATDHVDVYISGFCLKTFKFLPIPLSTTPLISESHHVFDIEESTLLQTMFLLSSFTKFQLL